VWLFDDGVNGLRGFAGFPVLQDVLKVDKLKNHLLIGFGHSLLEGD
jgi:hypothetical protein